MLVQKKGNLSKIFTLAEYKSTTILDKVVSFIKFAETVILINGSRMT